MTSGCIDIHTTHNLRVQCTCTTNMNQRSHDNLPIHMIATIKLRSSMLWTIHTKDRDAQSASKWKLVTNLVYTTTTTAVSFTNHQLTCYSQIVEHHSPEFWLRHSRGEQRLASSFQISSLRTAQCHEINKQHRVKRVSVYAREKDAIVIFHLSRKAPT